MDNNSGLNTKINISESLNNLEDINVNPSRKNLLTTILFFLILEKNLGRLSTALILNKKENGFYEALLDNQLPILIEKNKDIMPGEIVKVKVERIKNGKLVGKIN